MEAQKRFISEYIERKLDINKKSKVTICEILLQNKYPKQENDFDYLLRMPIYSLTLEKIELLNKQVNKTNEELLFYKQNTAESFWEIDLQHLQNKL